MYKFHCDQNSWSLPLTTRHWDQIHYSNESSIASGQNKHHSSYCTNELITHIEKCRTKLNVDRAAFGNGWMNEWMNEYVALKLIRYSSRCRHNIRPRSTVNQTTYICNLTPSIRAYCPATRSTEKLMKSWMIPLNYDKQTKVSKAMLKI